MDPGTNSASTYTVSFRTVGGSPVPSVAVTGGSRLSKTITAPTKEDPSGVTTYYFGDWYITATEHTGKTKYDYAKPVTGNITLYARWYTKQPADSAGLKILIAGSGDNDDLNHIDVRKVTDMNLLFENKLSFGDISGWDVSSVTNMHGMFSGTSNFNQPIEAWNVSGVTDMSFMFSGASKFNQTIEAWNVSGVNDMKYMFRDASEFNQPIEAWNVFGVNNMRYMFSGASKFNQLIENWDVSGVIDMSSMFYEAQKFDQNISGWTVSQVTDYTDIFTSCPIGTAHRPPLFQ
ncbi:BspA family leucine-rich repeat surface protein [Candidatus Haliotispira prima]|uniref:BspA family leucine-rich repeat surface protein n=1 Tax=Candidatus Haliotispira prima TaxID=3034016 RepID=A0ABY8MJS2_9SPIO|nr:BspA family leucine-rich repeat surface protein [Candidatus Haliotispira prima]